MLIAKYANANYRLYEIQLKLQALFFLISRPQNISNNMSNFAYIIGTSVKSQWYQWKITKKLYNLHNIFQIVLQYTLLVN